MPVLLNKSRILQTSLSQIVGKSFFRTDTFRRLNQFAASDVVCYNKPNVIKLVRQFSLGKVLCTEIRTFMNLPLNHLLNGQSASYENAFGSRKCVFINKNVRCIPRLLGKYAPLGRDNYSTGSTGTSNNILYCDGRSILTTTSRSGKNRANTRPRSEDTNTKKNSINELADHLLLNRERWALAKAITLVESTNHTKRKEAQRLMTRTLEHLKTKESGTSFRIGMSEISRGSAV